MARRGDQLREHILWTAKDTFIEMGFERTSMDLLAARAETSKRTLYAHFDNKDTLFLAVVDFVRELHRDWLRTPADYKGDRVDALTAYCVRLVRSLVWIQQVRTCRLVLAEAERLPRAATDYRDAVFAAPRRDLAAFVESQWGCSETESFAAVDEIFARAAYPPFVAALFGVDEPTTSRPDALPSPDDPDYEPMRRLIRDLLGAR